MIDEKKIAEAASAHLNDVRADYGVMGGGVYSYPSDLRDIEEQIKDDFTAGANWALQEFKTLWHDTSEEPEGYDEWVLLHYSVGNYYSLQQVTNIRSWENFVKNIPIESWCYIDDLLPKEGGEV